MRPPSLPERMGFAGGQRYALLAVPDALRPQFAVLPDGTLQADRELDIAVLFVADRAMLEQRWADLAPMLGPDCIVWLCWPRPGVLRSDLDEPLLVTLMAARGFQAARSLAIDEVWSALQLSAAERT